MASFNQTILIGNMTRDPQGKHLGNQTFVAEFGLACNRKFKTSGGEEREEVLFIDCAAFGKTGELINQYFTKGKPIFVVGRLKLDQWEDKKDGSKRSKISLVVDNFQFIGGRDGEGDGGERQEYADARGGGSTARGNVGGGKHADMFRKPAGSRPVQPPFSENQEFEDDSIPF